MRVRIRGTTAVVSVLIRQYSLVVYARTVVVRTAMHQGSARQRTSRAGDMHVYLFSTILAIIIVPGTRDRDAR